MFQKRVLKYFLLSNTEENEIEEGWFTEEQMVTELKWSKNLCSIIRDSFLIPVALTKVEMS